MHSVLPSEIRHALWSVKNQTAPSPDSIGTEHLTNLPPVTRSDIGEQENMYVSKNEKQMLACPSKDIVGFQALDRELELALKKG